MYLVILAQMLALATSAVVPPPPVPEPFDLSVPRTPKALLVLHFVTTHVLHEFTQNLKFQHYNFYSLLSNASVVVTAPHQKLTTVMTATVREGCMWSRRASECDAIDAAIKMLDGVPRAALRVRDDEGHPLLFGPAFAWTFSGVEYLFVGVVVEPPAGWYEEMQQAGLKGTSPSPGVPLFGTATCLGKKWSFAYCMYSGAVFSYQLLYLPLLQSYTFYVKIDTDIVVRRKLPFDLGVVLRSHPNLHVAHTEMKLGQAGVGESCHRGIHQALTAYLNRTASSSSATATVARSARHAWCGATKLADAYFYGNFVAFSTAFARIARPLASYLYHEAWRGYFQSRWTDQPVYMALLCFALDVPSLFDESSEGPVWHMRGLRNHYFVHKRNDVYRTHLHGGQVSAAYVARQRDEQQAERAGKRGSGSAGGQDTKSIAR